MAQKYNRQHGFSHVMAIGGVVVVSVLVGTFMVVRSHAGSCVQNVYSTGVNGSSCVGYIQQLTNYHTQYTYPSPITAKLAVDNSFGPKTKAAILAFQKYWGLKQDGVVGPQTWRQLCSTQISPNMGSGGGYPTGYPVSASQSAGCPRP